MRESRAEFIGDTDGSLRGIGLFHPETRDPIQALEYFMQTRGLSRTDLIPILGRNEHVSRFSIARQAFT